MPQCKCDDAGVGIDEVDAAFSIYDCFAWAARRRPNGLNNLELSAWACMRGATRHDRDVNVVRNIRRLVRPTLAKGIPVTLVGEDVDSRW